MQLIYRIVHSYSDLVFACVRAATPSRHVRAELPPAGAAHRLDRANPSHDGGTIKRSTP